MGLGVVLSGDPSLETDVGLWSYPVRKRGLDSRYWIGKRWNFEFTLRYHMHGVTLSCIESSIVMWSLNACIDVDAMYVWNMWDDCWLILLTWLYQVWWILKLCFNSLCLIMLFHDDLNSHPFCLNVTFTWVSRRYYKVVLLE